MIERCISGRDRRRRADMIEKAAMFVPSNQKRTVGADLLIEDCFIDILDQYLAHADGPRWMLGIAAAIAGKAVFRFDESISDHIAARHVGRKIAKRPKEGGVVSLVDHSLQTQHLRVVETEQCMMVIDPPRDPLCGETIVKVA